MANASAEMWNDVVGKLLSLWPFFNVLGLLGEIHELVWGLYNL